MKIILTCKENKGTYSFICQYIPHRKTGKEPFGLSVKLPPANCLITQIKASNHV